MSSASVQTVQAHGRIDRLYRGLATFVIRFRWAIVVFWILVAVVTSATMPSLGSEVNDNNTAFLPANAPSQKASNLATPLIGSTGSGKTSQITIIASTAGRPLTSADLAATARVARLAQGVGSVISAKITGLSPDRSAALVQVRASLSQNDITKDKATIDALQAKFAKASPPPGLQFHLAGQVAAAVANQASSAKSGSKVQNLSLLFVILLLLVVFRSLPAAIVTLLPSGLALAISMRLIGALGAGGLRISSITQVLLIVLLIGAGTDYGLFLVFRVRENLRDGLGSHDAVRKALVSVGESITGSAGTVVLALLTLLLAGFGLYHDLGVPLAVGVAVMLLLGLTLLPALLAILGTKAFWPTKPKPEAQREGIWGRVARTLVSRPGLTLGIGVLAFLALALGALGYKGSGFGGATSAPKGSSAATGNALLAKHFPQTSNNPANLVLSYPRPVWSDPAQVRAAESALKRSGRFTTLAGPLDPNGTQITPAQLSALYRRLGPPQRLAVSPPPGLKVSPAVYDAYRSDATFVSASGTLIQFEAGLTAGAQDSTAAMNATPRIRTTLSAAGRAAGATATGLAGEAAAVYDINHTANQDLVKVVPVAIVAIGLLLALVLRSAIAPLYLIVSVALSYLASLGVAVIVFMDLGGEAGISFILPFLMFIFLLALGEDYNILVMTRIREEARQLPLREAVIKAVSRTGSTVTSAGVILGGTFAVFAIVGGGGSEGSQLRAIGFGLAFGILMDTFLVRTLLVPSTVMLLGRWNWWPSRVGQEPEGGAARGHGLEPSPAAE